MTGEKLEYPHRPVLVQEVVKYLITVPDGLYVDGTVGIGGHSEAIGKALDLRGRLICIDRDQVAVRLSGERLLPLGERLTLIKASYADINRILQGLGFEEVDGILLDLGMSSYQLEKSGRGFSFSRDEPLDMRMDPDDQLTAHHIINDGSPRELEKILRKYGEEKRARTIVKSIERARSRGPVNSSIQLAEIIQSAISPSRHYAEKHPATRTFQALRIAVNKELENLKVFLEEIPPLIKEGGRLVILSYHSLEDRLVKRTMVDWEKQCECPPDMPVCSCEKIPLFKRLHKKGIKPSQREIAENPRSRSAMLRAAERI